MLAQSSRLGSWRRVQAIVAALCVSVAVGSCGGVHYPFGKGENLPTQAVLAVPPANYFDYATPEVSAQVDYETLHGPGRVDPSLPPVPDDPSLMAGPIGPSPTELAASEPLDPEQVQPEPVPDRIADAAPKPKPGARVIKAVAVPTVRGSPGNGNVELTAAMRRTLEAAGWPVLKAPRDDALTISGRVKLEPAAGGTQKVGLSWTVYSPDGSVLGAVKQQNDIPAGSISKGWGGTALHVAEAAATGIFDVVKRFR